MKEDQLMKNSNFSLPEKHRGKLKIFFGYAAGVGKTYAMLSAAREAKKNGIDIVAGYIEPHSRPETLALLHGIEQIPFLDIDYKGTMLREFDLDAVLQRNPTIVLVDELAHHNAPLCRHKNRYQDIEELLKQGINVYTTVNVQHIESLNDVVASITNIFVKERIPDYIFNSAHQVELVDIEPEDLIERLQNGHIYSYEQSQTALTNFFTKENLVALREIALRRTADKVNRVADGDRIQFNKKDYITSEHILTCISASPSNAKVIRSAARIADAFHGTFTAIYVASTISDEDAEDVNRLKTNIRLAEDLGAKIITVYGDNIAMQISEYAKTSGISKIVLGRSNNKKRLFYNKPSFMEQLTILAPNIDIYIIPDNMPAYRILKHTNKEHSSFSIIDIMKCVVILSLVSIIGLWFYGFGFSDANMIMLYLLGVLLIAITTTGRVYSAISSILGVMLFNFFFTIPRFSLNAYDAGYPITFVIMLIASLIVSTLTSRVKEQARLSAGKAYRTEILLETSQMLQSAENTQDIYEEILKQLSRLLDRKILIYPIEDNELGEPILSKNGNTDTDETAYAYLNDGERAVARWVYKNNKHAGATTNTLPGSTCLYLAVRGHNEVYAVAGIVMDENKSLEAYVKSLLIAMLNECGLALEKSILMETKNQIMLQAQNEKLRANLLRAISHDLRTPLTSISGNAGVLIKNSEVLDTAKKLTLYNDIYDDSMWLIQLVENLLAITKIENGGMNLKMVPELIEEVVQEAFHHISRKKSEYEITMDIDDELLMAWMDSRLIIQVIINLIDNAIKYTKEGSKIKLRAYKQDDYVYVEVADNGEGIEESKKEKIFNMFYTVSNALGDSKRSLGLGLFLCKAIIEAHGGDIGVKDNLPHGSIFYFTLKSKEVYLQ